MKVKISIFNKNKAVVKIKDKIYQYKNNFKAKNHYNN